MSENRMMERKMLILPTLLSVFLLCACDSKGGVEEYTTEKGKHSWYCAGCIQGDHSSSMHGNAPAGHSKMTPHSGSKNKVDSFWKWTDPKQWQKNDAGSMAMVRYSVLTKVGNCECSVLELSGTVLEIVNILRQEMGQHEAISKENLVKNKRVWITGRLLFENSQQPSLKVFWQEDALKIDANTKIALRSLLAEHGRPISENAKINISGNSWQIEDGDKRYFVQKEAKKLSIYNNLEAMSLDISGSYHGMNMEKSQGNYRMLAAVIATDTGTLLIKMVGPKAAVEETLPSFMSFCRSFKIEKN